MQLPRKGPPMSQEIASGVLEPAGGKAEEKDGGSEAGLCGGGSKKKKRKKKNRKTDQFVRIGARTREEGEGKKGSRRSFSERGQFGEKETLGWFILGTSHRLRGAGGQTENRKR